MLRVEEGHGFGLSWYELPLLLTPNIVFTQAAANKHFLGRGNLKEKQ